VFDGFNQRFIEGPGAGWVRRPAPPGCRCRSTAAFDILVSRDGFLYAATHGRGIWKTPLLLL
jgi:hypothetical protein